MNRDLYIKQFKKALGPLPAKKRKELVAELTANLADFGGGDGDLVDHFGTPQDLAMTYLENHNIHPLTKGQKYRRFAKRALMVSAIMVVGGGIGLYSLWLYIKAEPYDPLDRPAREDYYEGQPIHYLPLNPTAPISLKIEQARVHIVGDESLTQAQLRCHAEDHSKNIYNGSGQLYVFHSTCLLEAPAAALEIEAVQAWVRVFNPLGDMEMDLHQSGLKLAPPLDQFRIKWRDKGMSMMEDGLISGAADADSPAPLIDMRTYQSEIEIY